MNQGGLMEEAPEKHEGGPEKTKGGSMRVWRTHNLHMGSIDLSSFLSISSFARAHHVTPLPKTLFLT